MEQKEWIAIATATHGNPWKNMPKMCVVSARYSGAYEGGRFVAISVDDLGSDAFGSDTEAMIWWHENADRAGAGETPNDAILDWYHKREGRQG
jgi:hypothetical protein